VSTTNKVGQKVNNLYRVRQEVNNLYLYGILIPQSSKQLAHTHVVTLQASLAWPWGRDPI